MTIPATLLLLGVHTEHTGFVAAGNTPLVITSDSTPDVATGDTAVVTVTTTGGTGDIDFAIIGGADAGLFTIDDESGDLAFTAASVDGTYEVIVRAFSDWGSATQDITVTVATPSYTGPLDLVAGATLAFSPARALSAAWIGQNVIRLRRDSDDAELDFVAGVDGSVSVAATLTWRTFTQTGAVTDTSDIITFVDATGVKVGQAISGANIPADTTVIDISSAPDVQISNAATGTSGSELITIIARAFAVTVYDQSGNGYDVTQADTTRQPAWIANSTNNRPGLRYDGTARMFGTDDITFSGGAYTAFGVAKYTRDAGAADGCIGGIADPDGGVAYALLAIDLNTGVYKTRAEAEDNADGFQRIFSTESALLFDQFAVVDSALSLTVHSAFINNADVSGATAISDAIATFTGKAGFGSESTGNFSRFIGDICEFLFYPSIISLPNRALVRPNEATYYDVALI